MKPPNQNNPDTMIRIRGEHSRHHHSHSHSRARRYPFSFYAASQSQILEPPAVWGGAGDAKLCISNLDSGVTAEDLEVLFSELGELKAYSVHYDMRGNSLGTGEVVYVRKEDAVAARNRYNGVKLDGKRMIIGFVGVDLMTSSDPPPKLVGAAQADSNILFESTAYASGGYGKRGRESAGGGGTNHDDQGMKGTQEHQRHRARTVTVEELDAELDNYWILPASSS